MKLSNFLYKVIYQPNINRFLRGITFPLRGLLPDGAKLPPSGSITLRTTAGPLTLCTNQTSYLTKLLYWNGYKNFEYSAIFEKMAKEFHSFLDIGSNMGYYALLAAKSNPGMKVFAFEPAYGPKAYLNKNIGRNRMANQIKSVDLALSNAPGTLEFYEVQNDKYTHLKYNLAGEGNAGTKKTSRNFAVRKVQADTLNNFVSERGMDTIDLIKLDTEGTEMDILRAGDHVIDTYRPLVICEILFQVIESDLEEFFGQRNYHFYVHLPNGLKKVDTLQRSSDDGIRNCFFVPSEKWELVKEYKVNAESV